jgi:hypothetical protein
MVPPALLAVPEMLVPLAAQAKPAPLAQLETPARTAHPVLATTAHRPVWLQVIKRSRSTSRATTSWPDRSLFNDKEDQFVKIIFCLFTASPFHPGLFKFLLFQKW